MNKILGAILVCAVFAGCATASDDSNDKIRTAALEIRVKTLEMRVSTLEDQNKQIIEANELLAKAGMDNSLAIKEVVRDLKEIIKHIPRPQ